MPGFANSQGPTPSTDIGFPDACKTIVGPAVVVIPYPSVGMRTTAPANQTKILVSAMPIHNIAVSIPLTNGDNAGTLLGTVSQTVMGPSRCILGSTNFFVAGKPVTTMGAPTMQNNQAPGITSAPTQTKLMSMR